MRKSLCHKICSWILLLLMLSVAINGMHAPAHAAEDQTCAVMDQGQIISHDTSHHCPSHPTERHTDYDGCDSCINCACHAPLTVRPFELDYTPIILGLQTSDPFRHLPEVYLSRFVPPQLRG